MDDDFLGVANGSRHWCCSRRHLHDLEHIMDIDPIFYPLFSRSVSRIDTSKEK